MAEVQYLDIILNGLIYHKDTYTVYLRRKLKEAETQNFVSENEFLINCNEVIKQFYNDFNKQYLFRKAELYKIVAYSKQNKESYNDVSEDLKQLNINQFVIHLHSYTNGKFNGDLYFDDFVFIHSELEKIANKFSKVLDIFKEPLKEIDFHLNNYFENLEPLELTDFLKWLEFEVLSKWQLNKKLNSQQTNIVGDKFLSFHSEKFNQKIDYLENWINEKKAIKPINKKAINFDFQKDFTFTKYKNDYPLLLESHLKQYVDNTEQTFIKQQLFSFNEYLSFMVNGTMTKAKKQMLLEDLEQPKTLDDLKQSTEQKIEFLEDKLKGVLNNKEPQQTKPAIIKTEIDYKNTIWFKTGIPLATGEAFILYKKYINDRGHFKKICLELGFKPTDRPYFSDTINDNSGDKNTFSNKDKLQKLHKHLTENQLNFGIEFLNKYNQIELE